MVQEQRLALFVATLGGGGAERVMVTMANGLSEKGYRVDLVLGARTGHFLEKLDTSIRIIDLASTRIAFSFLPLVRYLRREHPVALLATQGHVNIIAILARMIARVPVRLLVRETSTLSVFTRNQKGVKTRATLGLARLLYRLADCVIAPSQGVKDDLVRELGLPEDRVKVISNPLSLDAIRKFARYRLQHPWLEDGEVPVVLSIGRLSPQKDFVTLLSAFAKVLIQRDSRLVILGEGEDRGKLESMIDRLGLKDRVDLRGFVDNPFAYLGRSALFVLSSPSEGLPNTLLEAMAVGVPVIATDCPSGPKEILEGGRWGRLTPVGDVDAMADAILDGLDGRIIKAPLSSLEQRYGVRTIVEQYVREMTGA